MAAAESDIRHPVEVVEPPVAAKLSFLSNPASYAARPFEVIRRETHFAWVFLAGNYAYKMKKPSQLRGADWRSIQARELACREELRLNRRMSAPTYLSVEPLVQTPSGLRIAGRGRPVDWLLVMRRLDERRMLDAVLKARRPGLSELDAVLTFLFRFYSSRAPVPCSPDSYLERLAARIDEALTALGRGELGLPSERTAPLREALPAAFAALRSELAERALSRHIADVHGDLRAEHVWLGPPVQVIDAMEVHDDLRVLDTAEEIAMLALDCERLARPWVASYLRDHYRLVAADPCSNRLFEFYMALRAATQAKLALWHLDDPEQYPDPSPWRAHALAAADLATAHCRAAMPVALASSG
ncbi:MAG: hypothetical protein JSR36_08385 [Proteobacteria bacterium]|nr:hypothetical protein [Pseudomonadota bacterium]